MNYFAYRTAAERYAHGRPYFHPLALEKIANRVSERARIDRALGVGCGTGQSAVALLKIADQVVGIDNSADMLAYGLRRPEIHYVQSGAEQMPLAEASFPLVTVALALLWFDRERFMREAHRVLRPGGRLVIYNDGFSGKMGSNANYEVWNREKYMTRYPTPPRNITPFAEADLAAFGFHSLGNEEFRHEVEFDAGQLVSYLLTQTNVIAR